VPQAVISTTAIVTTIKVSNPGAPESEGGWRNTSAVPTTNAVIAADANTVLHDLVKNQLPQHLSDFHAPALVVWASQDRVMPPAHGRRLAELLPQGRLVEIPDSYTLVPLDQPIELARAIREFTHQTDAQPSTTREAAQPLPSEAEAERETT